MRLTIPAAVLAAVVGHCWAAAPAEACGLLIGPVGGPVTRCLELSNAAPDPYQWFAFDPAEQLAVYRAMDARGEDPLAVWHSHPTGVAVPSPVDVAAMRRDPGPAWLVISPAGEKPTARLWRTAPHLTELTLTVTEDGIHDHDAPTGAAVTAL